MRILSITKKTVLPLAFMLVCMLAGAATPVEQVQHNLGYEIWVELDHSTRMLNAKETLEWTNHTGDEINDMWFHLYWNAFKNEKSTMYKEAWESGYSGGRFREKQKEGPWGWIDVKRIALEDGTDLTPTIEYKTLDQPVRPDDRTVMRVKLPQPLAPGETVRLNLQFQSKVPRTFARAGYYGNSYFIGQWFPKPGVYEEGKGWNCHEYHYSSEFFADFAQFKVHMTVPKEFVLGATGKEIARKEDQAKGTVTYTHVQDRVHDFAWTADPDYIKVERDFIADKEVTAAEYAQLAKRLQVPVEELKLKNVKMILLINPEHDDQIDRHFKALRMSLKYYGLWYGPYPYETMTLLDPPYRNDCGGMEYPTLITGGTQVFPIDKPGSPEGVIIHEFGHNFWYGLVANNEFEEAWLDEGINSYSDGKVMAEAYGPLGFPMPYNGIPLNRYFDLIDGPKDFMNRAQALLAVELDPIVKNSWQFYSGLSYGGNVYGRAATCLHTLERILGEDVMIKILRTFQLRFRYKHPSSQDFFDVVNEVTQKDMGWFFDEFFFKTNHLDYGIRSIRCRELKTAAGVFDKEGKRTVVSIKEAKKLNKKKKKKEKKYLNLVNVGRFGTATLGGDVKLKVKVVFEDGSEEIRFWNGKERWARYRFVGPSKVKYAQVDPETVFLIDANFTNNSMKRKPDATAAARMSNKLHFWLQNIMQIFSSVS